MICFVIEYTKRFDTILREIGELFSIFKKHLNNITIFITKSENVKEKTKENLKFETNKKFKIQNIFFTKKILMYYNYAMNWKK